MDLIQILFSAAIIYGLNKLVRVYRKKEEILPEKPMAKVEPVKNWAEMDAEERRDNWGDIVKGFNNKNT